MSMVLETKELTKKFGSQAVVDKVSLHIEAGSVYGLLGPNGAGKTTTLKMLMGLLRPTDGEICLFGKKWERKALRYVGALIESPALYGNLTARENLMVHARLMDLTEESIDRALGAVGLSDAGKKRVAQFSLGMKQRAGIALALLGDPQLLILDEPTNGLDPVGIQELRELIRAFPSQGITVILSSHMLGEVAQTVETVGIMQAGKLEYEGPMPKGGNLETLFMSTVQGRVAC